MIRSDDPRVTLPGTPGFGIYIHWPFCAQKCPYCDFNSHVRFGGWDEAQFLESYKRELSTIAAHVQRAPVTSIFFGGGTPSLMQAKTVSAILEHIAVLWPLSERVEISLEANPNSVEQARFREYREAGINRVSIGVQSLSDRELKALGRLHSSAEAKAAIRVAEKTFDRFSFDLIYARPGQTVREWRDELSAALALTGGHVSLYQLTIEDGTPFAERHRRGQLIVPDDDLSLALYDTTQDLTEAAGLPAYEISNHARPGDECRHNLTYWRYGPYVGVGPGAHGRVVWDGDWTETITLKNPEVWCNAVLHSGHGIAHRDTVDADAQGDEYVLMGLRVHEGIDLARLTKLRGFGLNRDCIEHLVKGGFVAFDDVSGAPQPRPNALSGSRGDPSDRDGLFGGELKACLGPGLEPTKAGPIRCEETKVTEGRLRVTTKGRFVLDKIVYHLASGGEGAGCN